MIPLFSISITTPSILESAAAGNGYCQTLVILEWGNGMGVSSRLNATVPNPFSCPANLHTVPSGSFHTHPRSTSNPKRFVCAAPTNTSFLVILCSPGNQKVIFAVGHVFITPSIPINLTLRRVGFMPKSWSVLLVITDFWAPISMRNAVNIFWGPMGRVTVGLLTLPGSH